LSPAATQALAQVYPSVRGQPPPSVSVRAPGPVERTVGPPAAPGRPQARAGASDMRERATVRGAAGEATGTADPGRSGRPIARSSEGEAVGTVDPARSGGGVVRAPDGTARGIVPARPSARGMGAMRR
jgi:hypothetical protein